LDIIAYLASGYCSLTRFGLIFGPLAGLVTLGERGLGALALNTVLDPMQSYGPALWVAILMCIAASRLIFRLGPYPEDATRKG